MIAGPPMSFGMMKGNDTTLFLTVFIQNFSSLSHFGLGHYGVNNKIKLHRISVSTSQAITFILFIFNLQSLSCQLIN